MSIAIDKTKPLLDELASQPDIAAILSGIAQHPEVTQLLEEFLTAHPNLHGVIPDLLKAYDALVRCFAARNTLFLCGNGGSFSDALHISGEFLKSLSLIHI